MNFADKPSTEISREDKLPQVVRWIILIVPIILMSSLLTYWLENRSEKPIPSTISTSSPQIDSLKIQISNILERLETQRSINGKSERKFNAIDDALLLLDTEILSVNERIDLIAEGEKK